jgi:DNA-directed RNA polymerase subunit RPC12/RpoP
MEVKCPKCGTINIVDDEILTETGIKIPCKGCGVKLVVKKKVKKASPPPPPPEPASIPEPPPLQFTEDDGFYMPDEGLKSSLAPESENRNPEDQFFDAGFSLGEEKESIKEPSGFDLPEISDLKGDKPAEEKIEEEVVFKEIPAVHKEKPADDNSSSFDMLTESLFTDQEVIESSLPIEEPKKPPVQPPKPSPVIRKSPSKKIPVVKNEVEKRRVIPLFIVLFILIGGVAGLYLWKGEYVINRFFAMSSGNEEFSIVIKAKSRLVNARGERLFYIVGNIRPKNMIVSNIKLRASIYDENDFEKSSIEFYAGNILKEEELRELSPFKVYERLQNEVGDMLSNLNVTPEKGVDFMAVFYDPPAGVVKFRVIDFHKK